MKMIVIVLAASVFPLAMGATGRSPPSSPRRPKGAVRQDGSVAAALSNGLKGVIAAPVIAAPVIAAPGLKVRSSDIEQQIQNDVLFRQHHLWESLQDRCGGTMNWQRRNPESNCTSESVGKSGWCLDHRPMEVRTPIVKDGEAPNDNAPFRKMACDKWEDLPREKRLIDEKEYDMVEFQELHPETWKSKWNKAGISAATCEMERHNALFREQGRIKREKEAAQQKKQREEKQAAEEIEDANKKAKDKKEQREKCIRCLVIVVIALGLVAMGVCGACILANEISVPCCSQHKYMWGWIFLVLGLILPVCGLLVACCGVCCCAGCCAGGLTSDNCLILVFLSGNGNSGSR